MTQAAPDLRPCIHCGKLRAGHAADGSCIYPEPSRDIVKEHPARPAHAVEAPLDFEDRAMDLAIEAMSDIAQCDQARVYVKWDKLAGKVVPLLYVLFRNGIVAKRGSLPRVHMDERGQLHPAHAICLAKMPSGTLMTDSQIRDTVRRGVEEYLLRHDVTISHAGPRLRLKGSSDA
jgi:hypothetical protein